ncbi:hypothetical protein G6046_00500 [Bacillus amyloliquefaciens]|nr:hypothetical protein [Bacillus amyloliquefaciens]
MLDVTENVDKNIVPSIIKPPELELKILPTHLKYVFLGNSSTLPVIISAELNELQEQKLLDTLKKYKKAFSWTLSDIKRISPSICMHRIILDKEHKPRVDPQRRLNPIM